MNGRLNGVVYRGDAVYYTFQRPATGASYLRRLEKRGKDLKGFRVTYNVDGKEVQKSAPQFLPIADKLAASNGKVKSTKGTKASKKPAAKPKTKKTAPQPIVEA